MKKRKPRIFVTGPDKGGTVAWLATRFAVFRSGGKAIRITPSRLGKLKKNPFADGLIIGGGADIDPGRYEDLITDLKNIRYEPEKSESFFYKWISLLIAPFIMLLRKLLSTRDMGIDQARDEIEIDLLKKAIENAVPVLGICRGSQLINIFFGGTLYQDLANYYKERPHISTILPRKSVTIKNNSLLFSIIQKGTLVVNSLHNQAVENTGKNISIVAHEESGVVQAIEHTEHPFIIGVQWHPEYLPQSREHQSLFQHLIQQSCKRKV